MIGELFNALIDEVVGDDPATRQSAALPYIFSKYAAYTGAANTNAAAALQAQPAAPVPVLAPPGM